MLTASSQSPWLARVLTDESNPSWPQGKKRIRKSSLSFRVKFWWAIVRLKLMLTGVDANLDNQRKVLVASMIDGLNIEFGHIIIDKIFIHTHKTAKALPFLYLITKLCRQANVTILKGVDDKVQAFRILDIEWIKDNSKFKMRVHKPSTYETLSAPIPKTSEMPPGMPLPLTTYAPPRYMPPGTSVGLESMPPVGKTSDTTSIPLRYFEYRLTQENFAKTVKAQKKLEQQLNIWLKEFKRL